MGVYCKRNLICTEDRIKQQDHLTGIWSCCFILHKLLLILRLLFFHIQKIELPFSKSGQRILWILCLKFKHTLLKCIDDMGVLIFVIALMISPVR